MIPLISRVVLYVLGNKNDIMSHLCATAWSAARLLAAVTMSLLFLQHVSLPACITAHMSRSGWLSGCVLGCDGDDGRSSAGKRKRMWSGRPKKD